MKCRGKLKFKGLIERKGGEFINNEGRKVPYNGSYQLKVDEVTEEGVFERTFKIPLDSPLVNELKDKKLYSDIVVDFDVVFYQSSIRLVPVSIANQGK